MSLNLKEKLLYVTSYLERNNFFIIKKKKKKAKGNVEATVAQLGF